MIQWILVGIVMSLFASRADAAVLAITVPNGEIVQVREAFAGRFGYTPMVPDIDPRTGRQREDADGNLIEIPNPESTAAFTKRMITRLVFDVVIAYEVNQDAETVKQDTRGRVRGRWGR